MALYNIDTGKLRTEADELNKTKNDLFKILDDLKNKVNEINKEVWDDTVAQEFTRKFKGLSNDFQNYDKILGDYVNKAKQIADEYDKANADANKELESLLSDL